jgi:hypothetical protein
MKIKLRQVKLSENKGALMVEILMTVALFSTISITIASLLLTSSVISRTNDAHARLNENAMKILHYIGNEIRVTSSAPNRLAITNGGAMVRFQIPVDDGTGVVIDPLEANSKWGAYDQIGQTVQAMGNPINRWVQYSVNNNQLIRQVCLDAACAQLVNGLSSFAGNNVQGLNVALANNSVTITITLRASNAIGVSDAQGNMQPSFSHIVYLRNAAN